MDSKEAFERTNEKIKSFKESELFANSVVKQINELINFAISLGAFSASIELEVIPNNLFGKIKLFVLNKFPNLFRTNPVAPVSYKCNSLNIAFDATVEYLTEKGYKVICESPTITSRKISFSWDDKAIL